MAVRRASGSRPAASASLKIIERASFDTAAQTCSRYSRSGTMSPLDFLDTAVAAEDFERGSEAGEDRVGADDAFLGETRHPFVISAGEVQTEHLANRRSRYHEVSHRDFRAGGRRDGRTNRARPSWLARGRTSRCRSAKTPSLSIRRQSTLNITSQPRSSLVAKTMTATPLGIAHSPPLGESSLHPPLVILFCFVSRAHSCGDGQLSPFFGVKSVSTKQRRMLFFEHTFVGIRRRSRIDPRKEPRRSKEGP